MGGSTPCPWLRSPRRCGAGAEGGGRHGSQARAGAVGGRAGQGSGEPGRGVCGLRGARIVRRGLGGGRGGLGERAVGWSLGEEAALGTGGLPALAPWAAVSQACSFGRPWLSSKSLRVPPDLPTWGMALWVSQEHCPGGALALLTIGATASSLVIPCGTRGAPVFITRTQELIPSFLSGVLHCTCVLQVFCR